MSYVIDLYYYEHLKDTVHYSVLTEHKYFISQDIL